MQFIRKSDWEDRLKTYLDRVAEDQFKWGTHDCALFASSAVLAMTGEDPAAAYRGQYSDELGARLALRQHGAGTLLKTFRSVFGPSKNVSHAQRGDLVMKDRTSVGVCVGSWTWFVGEEGSRQGLVVLPTSSCRYSFTVKFGDTDG